jgi:hypothetical protein
LVANTYDIGGTTSIRDIWIGRNVGIGVAPSGTAGALITATGNADQNTVVTVSNSEAVGTAARAGMLLQASTAAMQVQSHGSGRTAARFGVTIGGYNEIFSSAGNGLLVGTLGLIPVIIGTNSIAAISVDSTQVVTHSATTNLTGHRLVVGAKSADYTVTTLDSILTFDTTGATRTATLPAASSAFASNRGSCYRFKKLAAANSLVIARAGADTIDGAASVTLTALNESKDVCAISSSTWGTF